MTATLGALVGAVVLTASVGGAGSQVLFHIDDSRIGEASGIATGIASPGVFYVQNDSGDSARFFALDRRTGKTLATYTVPRAANVDWEDLAVARDRRGVASVWIADIGDNDGGRGEVRIYRVDEPHVEAGVDATTAAPDVWRLRYPGGPVDAESLAVAPGGAAYLVTKSIFGASEMYAVPARPDPAKVQALRRIGEIDFHPTGTPGGPNIVGQVTATGAALSRDGSILVVRTYIDAYLWTVKGGDVARAIRAHAVHVRLPEQPQGEGVTIDGSRLIVDSEHVGSAVFAVAMPRLPVASSSTPPRSEAASGIAPPRDSPAASGDSSGGSSGARWAVIGGFAAAVTVALAVIARRKRLRRAS